MTKFLIVDLETVAIKDAATYVEPVSAPSNYKDPEKIAAYERAETQKVIDKCATDPDLNCIVALGYMRPDEYEPVVMDGQDEPATLRRFWQVAANCTLVTFAGVTFDVPTLLRRSLYLGVPAPSLAISRYRHPTVIDLMQILSFDGILKWHGLKFYCNRLGLDPIEDDVDGADIPGLVRAGRWDAVRSHCRADVLRTKALALRVGAIPAPLSVVA